MFTSLGIPVLTADSLEEADHVDLSMSRLDIVNNYHARMLSTAILAARNPHLEYVQIVSFGCGHDAYLSDEIIRLMKEISGKTPLVLKLDESDIQGPLRIRCPFFYRNGQHEPCHSSETGYSPVGRPLPGEIHQRRLPQKDCPCSEYLPCFLSNYVSRHARQLIQAEPLEIGREEAIRLGKQYVHNDICFPCQIVIGEALAALKSGKYDGKEVAIGMGKYIGDCRLTHYSALLRKALDDAGFHDVPILTNDDVDYHNYASRLPE